uniref:SAP domain-containing protein n=1 Tax=Caenorhabditis tropicalis TaxID=1561998 RepID=A0A1I7TUB3_9PELO
MRIYLHLVEGHFYVKKICRMKKCKHEEVEKPNGTHTNEEMKHLLTNRGLSQSKFMTLVEILKTPVSS